MAPAMTPVEPRGTWAAMRGDGAMTSQIRAVTRPTPTAASAGEQDLVAERLTGQHGERGEGGDADDHHHRHAERLGDSGAATAQRELADDSGAEAAGDDVSRAGPETPRPAG